MKSRIIIALSLAIWLMFPAHAEKLYRIVDEHGNVTYTSTPPSGGESDVEVRDIYGGVDPSDEFVSRDKAIGLSPVTLYAVEKCRICDVIRKQLKARNVPFTDVDPSQDPVVYNKLQEISGGNSVPAISVGDKVISRYTYLELKKVLDAAGYPPKGAKPKPEEEF